MKIIAAIVATTAVIVPAAALAQFNQVAAGAPTTVDLGVVWNSIVAPLIPYIAAALGTLLTGVAGLALAWLRKKLKLQNLEMDQLNRDALQQAVTNAAGLALNAVGNTVQGKTLDVGHPAIADAVKVAMKNAPGAITYFHLTDKPEEIAEKILAKLPQIANTTSPQS